MIVNNKVKRLKKVLKTLKYNYGGVVDVWVNGKKVLGKDFKDKQWWKDKVEKACQELPYCYGGRRSRE